jgi:hypothetical protein
MPKLASPGATTCTLPSLASLRSAVLNVMLEIPVGEKKAHTVKLHALYLSS